ncbi:MAG: AraC family transcriptional regulator [Lachnospiraceae bacterium]|nr:AraC family transcriptional regulator [Lachnospiraceae bacterium]
MVLKYDFSTDEDNREAIPASEGFPFVIKYTDFSELIGGFAQWHWHEFFEITIPHRDGLLFQSADRSEIINRGEAVFVNTSMLHTVSWEDGRSTGTTYTFFFDRSILTGTYGSVFEEKYVAPVSGCTDLDFFVLRPDHRRGLKIMSLIGDIVELFENEPFGYEMGARSLLSDFWLLLLEETEELRKNSRRQDPTDSLRMKQMMNFVHDHYAEKLYLDEIAKAAGISTRECTRCFKRQIGQSPMDYLNQYRVRMAADALRSTTKPISLIGEECGFASDSYFGKTFREYMNCTPRDYRHRDP